jgi:ferredoxin/flavodoxin
MTETVIPIFYFSGTGNTWWVGNQIADELRERGCEVQPYSIEQVTDGEVQELIEKADMVGIGYPIYGSDAPPIMNQFIDNLPVVTSQKPMFIYVTQAAWSGDGAYSMCKLFEAKGYQIRWAVHFNMPNNINADFGWIITMILKLFQAKLPCAAKRAAKLAQHIVDQKTWIMGKSPFLSFGWTQRIFYRKGFDSFRKDIWSVDADKCTSCGRCVRLCPVDNITLVDGLPQFGDQCNICLRCFNYCPELAILAYKRPYNPDMFGAEPYQGPVSQFKPEMLTSKK